MTRWANGAGYSVSPKRRGLYYNYNYYIIINYYKKKFILLLLLLNKRIKKNKKIKLYKTYIKIYY